MEIFIFPPMQKLAATASSIPLIRCISKRINAPPEYVALGTAFLCFILIQRTPLGPTFATLMASAFVLKDSIVTLRQPAARAADLRKHVSVLSLFVCFIALENMGLPFVLPMFGLLKVCAVVWAGASADNAELVERVVFAKIPEELLSCGDGIEAAVRKAAKAVEKKAKESNGKEEEETTEEDAKRK